MNSNYTTVVGLVIAFMLCNQPAFSQTTFHNCSTDTFSLCVNDPGVSLPDNNQSLVGIGTPGATSCSVHLRQSRTISNTCGGDTTIYGVTIWLDTAHYWVQDFELVTLDSFGNATITFDTRNVSDPAIRANGLPYNFGCGNHYKIIWYVYDDCATEVFCEELVQLYDCHAPFITPLSGITHIVLPMGCYPTLHAIDFMASIVDDCLSEGDFLYSIKAEEYLPFNSYDPCDLPYGVEVPFSFWVADKGVDANCNGTIEWMERNRYEQSSPIIFHDNGSGVCLECFETYEISGKIATEIAEPVELVYVNMEGPGQFFPTYVTAEDGEFYFNVSTEFHDVTISAAREDNHKNGVSTLDLVLIQKHLLGIEPFQSPYKKIAADVNHSAGISAIDLIELRKLILGLYNQFPNHHSWVFVDKDYDFSDTTNININPYSIIIPTASNVIDADFVGIKIGDVNNTAQANLQSFLPRSPKAKVQFEVHEQSYKTGDFIDIPVELKSDVNVLGFQFTISSTDLEFLNVNAGTIDINENEFNIAGNDLAMSWFDIDPIHVGSDDKLFIIRARATRSGSLKQSLRISSDITDAELYDAAETVYEPVLAVQSNHDGVSLLPLTPNPASDHVTVPFHLPVPADVRIQFTSLDNKTVYSKSITGHAGRNEVVFPVSQLAKGVLICTLQHTGAMHTQKVIIIQ